MFPGVSGILFFFLHVFLFAFVEDTSFGSAGYSVEPIINSGLHPNILST